MIEANQLKFIPTIKTVKSTFIKGRVRCACITYTHTSWIYCATSHR